MTIVPYYPLGDEVLKSIIHLKLGQIVSRVRANYKAELIYDDTLLETVLGRCKEVETGARNVDHILTGTLLPEMARQFLTRMAEENSVTSVRVSADANGAFIYEIQ